MNNHNRGANTKSHWEAKHSSQMYEINRDYKYDHLDEIHYLKVVNQTIAENHQCQLGQKANRATRIRLHFRHICAMATTASSKPLR